MFGGLPRSFWAGCRPGTRAFYSFLLCAALFLAALPACPWAQRQIMQKFHLKTASFVRFALLQFLPSMYNFDNEALVSEFKAAADPFASDLFIHFQANHHPLRFVSFGLNNRREFLKNGSSKYVYLRSRFNGQRLDSLYVIEPKANTLNVKLEH